MSQQGPDMERYFRAIGQVTHAFSNLELQLAFVAMTLIGDDQSVGLVVTSKMSFSTLCSIIDALAAHYFEQDQALLDDFKRVVRKATDLEQKRNAMTHSGWGENENASLSRIKFSIRKGRLQTRMQDTTPGELEELAESIRKVPVAGLLQQLQTHPLFEKRLKEETIELDPKGPPWAKQ